MVVVQKRYFRNFAVLYDNMGAYEKALSLYQRPLDINGKVLGPELPDVATTLNDLGYFRISRQNGGLALC